MYYNYGYNGPTSAVIDTGGRVQVNPQKTSVVHAEPTFQTSASPYNVTYLSPITTQPTAGQVVVAPSRCQAQYPMLLDLGQAYSSSVGGGQCQPCKASTTPAAQPAPPKRVNRCCPGCAPCCSGECDTTEDSPVQPCCMCGTGCCNSAQPPNHSANAQQHSTGLAPHQDCCSCHGCQTNCCGQPCCVCHPCQTNNCCGPTAGCCGNQAGNEAGNEAGNPNGECCGPTGGCCGPTGGCCGPNPGCCGPNGECCGPNGGCCGNCCQPVQAQPAGTSQPAPVITTQPASIDVGPTNGPYMYRTSYNLTGFVPYTGQAVSVVPIDSRFSWGGAAVQPYTNVAKQVFT